MERKIDSFFFLLLLETKFVVDVPSCLLIVTERRTFFHLSHEYHRQLSLISDNGQYTQSIFRPMYIPFHKFVFEEQNKRKNSESEFHETKNL